MPPTFKFLSSAAPTRHLILAPKELILLAAYERYFKFCSTYNVRAVSIQAKHEVWQCF
jgi:hypothetical protein